MLTCLALAAFGTVSFGDIVSLAGEVEAEARSLAGRHEFSPSFLADLTEFSGDSMRLSDALRAGEAPADLPCIFRGIAEDAMAHAAELQRAATPAEEAEAFAALSALLDDAILLAPMAAAAEQPPLAGDPA
ncbi:MAG: hypothetical protein ABL883_09885 [Terricaulis sp.]